MHGYSGLEMYLVIHSTTRYAQQCDHDSHSRLVLFIYLLDANGFAGVDI